MSSKDILHKKIEAFSEFIDEMEPEYAEQRWVNLNQLFDTVARIQQMPLPSSNDTVIVTGTAFSCPHCGKSIKVST